MESNPVLGYLFLLLLFLLFFSASFYLGLREWRRPWDAVPLAMDVEYIRTENYFGQSFRAKMQEWLAAAQPDGAPPSDLAGSVRLRTLGGEHLLLLGGGRVASRNGREEVLYSEEDLALAGGSVFRREIYCRGRLETESGVALQSVAADGDVILGAASEVARWVDARGKIILRSGTVVRSRVSSQESIELERRVSAQSLYAPVISTRNGVSAPDPVDNPDDAEPLRQTPGSANDPEAVPAYLEGARCSRLGPRTWLVQGHLDLPSGCRVDRNLVVKGLLTSGPDCLFTGDIKAARITLRDRNRVYGNLVSEESLTLGEASFVEKNVAAGNDIRLSSGVRVGRPDRLAAVSAGGEIILEENVALCGKVTAGRRVRTL